MRGGGGGEVRRGRGGEEGEGLGACSISVCVHSIMPQYDGGGATMSWGRSHYIMGEEPQHLNVFAISICYYDQC